MPKRVDWARYRQTGDLDGRGSLQGYQRPI